MVVRNLSLALVILFVTVSACGGGAPQPDFQATISAAVNATRAASSRGVATGTPIEMPTVAEVSTETSLVVSAPEGGELTLPDKTVLRIPPGGLQKDTQVSIHKIIAESAPAVQQELVSVGSIYDIDLGTDQLKKPATLEIPFDPTLLPNDVESGQVFLSYYDGHQKEWAYAGGEVDTSRNVVVLQITHASWWMPTTWNWGAWIAILNKSLRISIVDWIEAAQLLTDDCPQAGKYVQVDSSQARNIVQGCVERDGAERPELRLVNPKSFFFEIQPISGGNGYPALTLLSPGEDLKFEASTSDSSPLIIEASMTQRSGWYLVVHMVITMLPGANQFGIQGRHVACITERLADVSYFASAVESLLVDHNGAAAAESISQFMLDGDAVRRFITAADDCDFGPASTWSVEGIRQIGGAVSTIMSATDYIANYFAGNTYAQVSFIWAAPGIGPEAVWNGDLFEFQNCLFTSSQLECVVSLMQASGASPQAIEFTKLLQWEAFMSSFEEYGVVDLAGIAYPSRANDNFQHVLVNGMPQIVHVEDVWNIDITQDSNYPALVQKYPGLSVWGGDNNFDHMERLPQGGQRFIFSYSLVDFCHACQTGNSAFIAFDFDSRGQFLGVKLLRLK